jgi:hypothetical protein
MDQIVDFTSGTEGIELERIVSVTCGHNAAWAPKPGFRPLPMRLGPTAGRRFGGSGWTLELAQTPDAEKCRRQIEIGCAMNRFGLIPW